MTLLGLCFSGSSLVIEDVTDQSGVIMVRARTPGGPVACPACGARAGQVHGYCRRTAADVPADGRPVIVRRMWCPATGCPVQTFREQVAGLLDRYQRRTTWLTSQAGAVAHQLAGRAGAGLMASLGVPLSRDTALRVLLRLPLPDLRVPRVLGVDDFALRRGQVPAVSAVSMDHGRGTRRTIKAALAPAWIEFAGGAQVAQVRRTVTRKGRKTVEVVHLITSDSAADPAALAAWARGHWEIENKLHWVRDVTYQEDKSLIRTGNAPRIIMATLRGLAISLLRLDGHDNIAAANRHHARDPQRTLTLLQTI
jgi:predicted transposase YbfD/YdcC